jgi:hypothetical protein
MNRIGPSNSFFASGKNYWRAMSGADRSRRQAVQPPGSHVIPRFRRHEKVGAAGDRQIRMP